MRHKQRLFKHLLMGLSISAVSISSAAYDYSDSHNFSIPQDLYDKPINQITLPGSHNSFNRSGTNPNSCTNNNALLSSNKNVHRSIGDQIDMGIRFLEIDVYKEGSRWCVYHGGGGQSALDGNNYYFADIISEIANGLDRIGDEVIFIKMDGYNSHENPNEYYAREDALTQELTKHGLQDAVYLRLEGEQTPPSINQLAAAGKRLIFVSGTKEYSWGWKSAGTSPKHTERSGPFSDRIDIPNGTDFIRWNAFALDDTFGWGSTGDADFLHARLIGHGIEKWAEGAHRISHLVVDFPSRQSVGMSAMRAANVLNQVPSAHGNITDANGNTLTNVGFSYWIQNANLNDQENWFDWSGYHGKTIIANTSGKFDFPRPHELAVSIRPYKEGYRFEPEAIYLPAINNAEDIELHFTAIPSRSLQDVAESHSFIYKAGTVQLAAGMDINADGQPVVNDVTRQPGFAIINKGSSLCIGLPKGNVTSGTKVYMQNCDASVEQRWSYNPDNGYVKSMKGNYCLDTSGNGNSGHHMQVWHCIQNPHPNLSFNLVGEQIVPTYTDANALDSHGTSAGAPLIVWNRSSSHNNRKWIFEKHYAVSAIGNNQVTDAASDNKPQYFALVNNSRNKCLTADGAWSTAYVKAKSCRTHSYGGNSNNMLWHEVNGQIRVKAGAAACLDNKGQLWNDVEPHIWQCIAGHPNMSWGINMPYWGGAARTREPLSIYAQSNNGIVIDHPRDNLVRQYQWANHVNNQGWVVVPVER